MVSALSMAANILAMKLRAKEAVQDNELSVVKKAFENVRGLAVGMSASDQYILNNSSAELVIVEALQKSQDKDKVKGANDAIKIIEQAATRTDLYGADTIYRLVKTGADIARGLIKEKPEDAKRLFDKAIGSYISAAPGVVAMLAVEFAGAMDEKDGRALLMRTAKDRKSVV